MKIWNTPFIDEMELSQTQYNDTQSPEFDANYTDGNPNEGIFEGPSYK